LKKIATLSNEIIELQSKLNKMKNKMTDEKSEKNLLEEKMLSGLTGENGLVDDFMQREFQILVIGVAMWSIVWICGLTVILYFVIDWIKKNVFGINK